MHIHHIYCCFRNDADNSRDQAQASTSKIIDEDYCSSEEEKSQDEKEVDDICKAINEGENKYAFDTEADGNNNPTAILEKVKRNHENEREEDR